MAPKAVSSWSNALDGPGLFDIDAPNDGQCGLFDVGAPSSDQGKPFAPNDNQCAPDESVLASPRGPSILLSRFVQTSRALAPTPSTLTP